jgi:hypothetical protein
VAIRPRAVIAERTDELATTFASRSSANHSFRFSIEAALSPGSRQAGGGDRDDLGQPSPDPGRRVAQKCTYLSHLSIFHRRRRNDRSQDGRTMENGLTGLTCRDVYENSNARFAGAPFGSGFIAAILPATREIFSPGLGS